MIDYMQNAAHEPASDAEVRRLLEGEVPETPALLRQVTAGMTSLTDFIAQQYLDFYIPGGGSKIKFVTGRQGSGKTHLLRLLAADADAKGYLTVRFSAKKVWLHDFREVYLEILRQCDLEEILQGCANAIIRDMGFDPDKIRPGQTFMDYLAETGEADALTRSELRAALRRFFTKNPLLDNCFAGCCTLIVGGILGHPVLEPASRELILSFLSGDKSVKLSQIRALGISPSRISKHNARNLLRSLAEVIHLAGYPGLIVAIDDMEVLLSRGQGQPMRYTKMRREDTYESIRQLIDDIDSMRYIMFFLSYDRELMDNESYGMKSYQALWFRIQSEIISTRFNRFADIIDLDRVADEFYSAAVLCEMSERLARTLQDPAYSPISAAKAEELRERSEYGGIGLPYLVNRAVVEGSGDDEEGGQRDV